MLTVSPFMVFCWRRKSTSDAHRFAVLRDHPLLRRDAQIGRLLRVERDGATKGVAQLP